MKIIIALLILFFSGVEAQNIAQQSNETSSEPQKRPSWSQGLPERQTAPTAARLMTKPVARTDVEPVREIFKPELEASKIDLNFQPKSNSNFNVDVEPVAVDLSQSRDAMRKSFYNTNNDEPKIELVDIDLLAQYKWQVIKITNVEVPDDFEANDGLNLNIHINPKGRVVKVVSEDTDVSSKALRMIEKSIKKWRFEPPADFGIVANINKSFNVDIQAD